MTQLHATITNTCSSLLPVSEGRQFPSGQDYNRVHAFSDQPA